MGSQQYTLEVLTGPLLDPQLYPDITLRVVQENKAGLSIDIPCHRGVLATQSPVFHAMFDSAFRESREQVVVLHEEDIHALPRLISLMYQREASGSLIDIVGLYKVACKYDVKHVVEQCSRLLVEEVHGENVGELYNLTFGDSFQLLRAACVSEVAQWLAKFGVDGWPEHDPTSALWVKLPEGLVLEVLSRDDLTCSEFLTWRAAVLWLQQSGAGPDVAQHVCQLIRFEVMSPEELKQVMASHTTQGLDALISRTLLEQHVGSALVKQLQGGGLSTRPPATRPMRFKSETTGEHQGQRLLGAIRRGGRYLDPEYDVQHPFQRTV